MNVALEDQIRGFARAYVESLPEVDIEQIRTRPRQTLSPKIRLGRSATPLNGRRVGSGPLVAVAAAAVVLVLGLGPMAMLRSNEASGHGTSVADSSAENPGSQTGEPTTIPTDSTPDNSTRDPDTAPTETVNGPLSQKLAQQVLAIPELAAFDPPTLKDFSEGGVDAAVVTFQAPDGAYVDVVSQQLPEPLAPDSVGSPDDTHTERGPNGEQIIIKETTSALQVVGVDEGNWMVNIIVNRTTAENPREASPHTDWSVDTVRSWVIQLLEQR